MTTASNQILPSFVLPSRTDLVEHYSGLDSLKECLDRSWFEQYPHAVEYRYNSRGFRDQEWPESLQELKDAIWCVGDSFTVGLGSPVEHTWPQVLQQQTGVRTINVSLDGASNSWISRKALDILREIQPKFLVVQWSYLHRREDSDNSKSDEQRRVLVEELDFNKNLDNFLNCVNSIEEHKNNCRVIHSIIPNTGLTFDLNKVWEEIKGPSWPQTLPSDITGIPEWIIDELKTQHGLDLLLLNNLKEIIEVRQLDRARDGHHYDLETSQQFCQQIIDCLR